MIGHTLQDGRYEVLRHLGTGRMGEIYSVWDNVRGGKLALKSLNKLNTEKLELLKAEFPEARSITNLHLSFLFDIFDENGMSFITVELLEDANWCLLGLEKEHLPATEDIRKWFAGIIRALACLHGKGACHGNLDEGDVIIDKDGDVRIYNYGFTFQSDLTNRVPSAQGVLNDWNSLGRLLYHGLTGRDYLDDPVSLEILKSVSDELGEVCVKLLQVSGNTLPEPKQLLDVLDPPVVVVDSREQQLLREISQEGVKEVRLSLVLELIYHYEKQHRYRDAYAFACKEVNLLGVRIPTHYSKFRNWFAYTFNKFLLGGRTLAELIDLKPMRDSRFCSVMEILDAALYSAWNMDVRLCRSLSIWAVNLSLLKGNCKESARFYAICGMSYRGGVLGELSCSHEAAKVASRLALQSGNTSIRAQVAYLTATFGSCWHKPGVGVERDLHQAYVLAMECGNQELVNHVLIGILIQKWIRGLPLVDLWDEANRISPLFEGTGDYEFQACVRLVKQVVRNLRGETPELTNLGSEDFNEGQFLGDILSFDNQYLVQFCYLFLANFYMIRNNTVPARIHAFRSRETFESSRGTWLFAEHHFIELVVNACDSERNEEKKLISSAIRHYQSWVRSNADNFEDKANLLFAEDYVINGRTQDAVSAFVNVAESARSTENLFIIALSYHRASFFPEGERYKDAALNAWKRYGVSASV